MRGKILGHDAAAGSGAIAAENGERFSFVSAQWRSDRPIAPGTSVDFAPVAGVATEIYPVGGVGLAAPDLAGLAASPGGQKLRVLATSTLAFPLAVLLLLATFLPALTSPVQGVSLWGIGSLGKMLAANPFLSGDGSAAAEQLAKVDEEENELRGELAQRGIPVPSASAIAAAKSTNAYMFFSGAPIASRLKGFAEDRAKYQQQVSDSRWRGLLSSLLVVRYLVPLGACLLLWLAWTDKPLRAPQIGVGAVAAGTALLIYLYRGAIVGHPNDRSIGGAISKQMDAIISIGLGTWVIGLLGIALVAAAFGAIRNPLAERA